MIIHTIYCDIKISKITLLIFFILIKYLSRFNEVFMKIVVDAFGGDNAPKEIVEGALLGLQKHDDLEIILCGDKLTLEKLLENRYANRVTIEHAPDIISNDDTPTEAIRKKDNSSLVKAFDILKNNDDVIALVSAGSTGAILTGAIMKIGRIKGISRPALAPILPTKLPNKDVLLIDSGANVDCKPINLQHFALMGSAYYSILYGVENPKVGLLSNGVEEHKGNELTKEAFPLLKSSPINFIGNVEAREYMSGNIDVMVAEGFAGNVLLKSSEGAVLAVLSLLKRSIKSHFLSKLGAIFMSKTFKELKNRIDVLGKHGGSPFLGCKKLVMKNHGSSNRNNIASSIEQAILLYNNKLIQKIEKAIEVTNANS